MVFNDWQIAQMTDADSVRVWDAYFNGYVEDLDSLDRMRLNLALLTQFRIYESAFYSNQYGLVGDDGWGRIERSNCRNYLRAESNSWGNMLADNLTERFFSYLVERCAE